MRKALTLLVFTLFFTGCGLIYRQPVFQGNLLESKNVEQLQAGMTRQQVFSLLGSPPVTDPFQSDGDQGRVVKFVAGHEDHRCLRHHAQQTQVTRDHVRRHLPALQLGDAARHRHHA